jgi:hypothetical protein
MLVQAKHMAVNLPRHIHDEDLTTSNPRELPLTQPCPISYVLCRLKLSEVAHAITELTPNNPIEASYDLVTSIDSKLQQFLKSLPVFFQMEKAHTPKVRQIDHKHPYIPMQRLVITMMINLGLCKLHFPFLVGSPFKGLHNFSRKTCLKAARSVLAAHRIITTSNLPYSSDFMKIQGTVQHMFMGAVVLATDLCCNQPRGPEREKQSSELMHVCSVLASIKQHSQIAAKFLTSLTELLVKYGVWSPSVVFPLADEPASNMNGVVSQLPQLSEYLLDYGHIDPQEIDSSFLFDDLWEQFVQKPSVLEMIDLV